MNSALHSFFFMSSSKKLSTMCNVTIEAHKNAPKSTEKETSANKINLKFSKQCVKHGVFNEWHRETSAYSCAKEEEQSWKMHLKTML